MANSSIRPSLWEMSRAVSDQEWEMHDLIASLQLPTSYAARESREQASVANGYCEQVLSQVMSTPAAQALPPAQRDLLRHNAQDLARNRWLSALAKAPVLPPGWAQPNESDMSPVGTTASLLAGLNQQQHRPHGPRPTSIKEIQ